MRKTLERIAFERVGGSSEEKKALDILANEIKQIGIEPFFEEFEVDTFKKGKGTVKLLVEPAIEFSANPIGLTGNADVTGKLTYIEPSKLEFIESAEDEIILLNRYVGYKEYGKIARAGAAAFLIVTPPGKTPGYPSIKEGAIEKFGKVPGAVIGYEAGRKLISNGESSVKLRTEQEEYRGTSHNLVAVVPGKVKDVEIILCAHADSVADSPGAIDNGAGCIELLGLLSYFAKNKPRLSMKFCFFGSEELGLLGSHAFVEKHVEELHRIPLVVNLDLGGDIFGDNKAIVTGSRELAEYIDSRSKIRGHGLKVTRDIYSSDNMPFARHGIQAISFGRTGLGSSMGHSRDDDLRNIDEKSLRSMATIALDIVDELANARSLPFDKGIPEDIAEKVEEYFRERQGIEPVK